MESLGRRRFVRYLAGGAAASLALGAKPTTSRPATAMGIASTSFSSGGRESLEFLMRCRALGAGGIQAALNGDLAKLRATAEESGMYIEGMAPLPRDGVTTAFEKSLRDAKEAGAATIRVAALSGRRYETFATREAWSQWKEQTLAALRLAVPLAEKQKVQLALENHKDWTVDEHEALLKSYSSEYLGVCLDFGNNIAMLDDPMETIERLMPYAFSTHVKDMAVQPYADGFLLSEVRLGDGILDIPKIVSALRMARPKTNLTLEMITRDPLKVPCLTDKYWAPFPERNGRFLARTVKLVNDRASKSALPMVGQLTAEERSRLEEENVKACLEYSRDKLGL
jgi:3-oxoisoapionate decarboxylase